MRFWDIELDENNGLKPWIADIEKKAKLNGIDFKINPDNKTISLYIPSDLITKIKKIYKKYNINHNSDINLPIFGANYIKTKKDAEKYINDLSFFTKNSNNIEHIIIDKIQDSGLNDIFDKFSKKSENSAVRNRLQLMIPKPKENKSTWAELNKNKSWAYGYDDDGNPRESVIMGTKAQINKNGGWNKPSGTGLIWTSSAKKTSNGWTSEWNDRFLNNMMEWWSPVGHLFKIKKNARILTISSLNDAIDIFRAYQKLGRTNNNDDSSNYEDDIKFIRYNFPWNEIQKHWDAIHSPMHNYSDEFLYGWDVESTVWLDPTVLEYLGKVPIKKPNNNEEN